MFLHRSVQPWFVRAKINRQVCFRCSMGAYNFCIIVKTDGPRAGRLWRWRTGPHGVNALQTPHVPGYAHAGGVHSCVPACFPIRRKSRADDVGESLNNHVRRRGNHQNECRLPSRAQSEQGGMDAERWMKMLWRAGKNKQTNKNGSATGLILPVLQTWVYVPM